MMLLRASRVCPDRVGGAPLAGSFAIGFAIGPFGGGGGSAAIATRAWASTCFRAIGRDACGDARLKSRKQRLPKKADQH